jgi:hypothetical protein
VIADLALPMIFRPISHSMKATSPLMATAPGTRLKSSQRLSNPSWAWR